MSNAKINVPVVIAAAALVVGIAVLTLTSRAPRWAIAVYVAAFLVALSRSSRQFRGAVFPHRASDEERRP
jgi:hypothetical protein